MHAVTWPTSPADGLHFLDFTFPWTLLLHSTLLLQLLQTLPWCLATGPICTKVSHCTCNMWPLRNLQDNTWFSTVCLQRLWIESVFPIMCLMFAHHVFQKKSILWDKGHSFPKRGEAKKTKKKKLNLELGARVWICLLCVNVPKRLRKSTFITCCFLICCYNWMTLFSAFIAEYCAPLT